MRLKKIILNDNYYMYLSLMMFVLGVLWINLVNTQPYSDFDYYYTVAKNVANGLEWGNTYTAVGYSIFLGFIFKVFGSSLIVVKIVNLILVALNNILFFKILKKVNIKEIDRKFIFALFVLFPSNLYYISLVAGELLFTFILLLATYIYFSEMKYKYVFIGILAGLNTMIKPFFIVFFFAIFLVDLIVDKKLFAAIKNCIIILIFSALVISPWIYRNTQLVGQFTYVSNNGGKVLYINNNSQNLWGRWMEASDVENSIVNTDEFKNANVTEQNKMFSDAAKEWIKSHPKEFLILGTKRIANLYFAGDDDVSYSFHGSNISNFIKYRVAAISTLIRFIIFFPAILYILFYSFIILKNIILKRFKKIDKYSLYNLVVFYMFTVIYFVTEGQGRYAFPLIFILIYYFYFVMKKLSLAFRKA
jgi:hypothetical protein